MDVSQINGTNKIDELIANAHQINHNGATSVTYYARMHGRRVFIKRLNEKYRLNPRYLSALEKEFNLGFRLEHSALPRYISYEGDAIIMDYIEGVTLTKFIEENPRYFFNKKNVNRFMSQLLDCLKYLHQNSILHLDLKPDNIMMTLINNDVKIIDLGFCYSDIFDDTIGYTNLFAAPELKNKNNIKIGSYTDVFSIGKILEYIIHGKKFKYYCKIAKKCQSKDVNQRPNIDTLINCFSNISWWRSNRVKIMIYVGILGAICLYIYNTILVENKSNKNQIKLEKKHQPIKIKEDSINNTDTVNEKDLIVKIKSPKVHNIIEPAPKIDKKEVYKYPAHDYPFQSKCSTMEVKRDWYRELRPIYDKLLDHYLAVDSIAWFNDAFRECSYQLIKDEKSLVYKNHNNISTDDIYNDGMHVYTMIHWMHQGLPVEISGYKRPPRPDLTKYANEQIALFEGR